MTKYVASHLSELGLFNRVCIHPLPPPPGHLWLSASLPKCYQLLSDTLYKQLP